MFKDYKEFIFIFSLFFILILSLGAISASEDLDNQMADSVSVPAIDEDLGILNGNNGEIETNIGNIDEENSLSEETPSKTITVNGGTFEDIQKAVDESSNGDTIELNGNFTSNNSGFISVQNKNLTIKGYPETVLDGKNLSGILDCYNTNISVIGLTFLNAGNYRAFSIEFGNCFLINCSFINNSAGAFNPYEGNISITNCSFINNSANEGAAILDASSILFLINCSFINNTAESFGGAINGFSNCSISNCSFINNSAREGGAMYIGGFSMNDCSFINNSADQYGGAIEVLDVFAAANCSFINNRIAGDQYVEFNSRYTGGAIYIYANGNLEYSIIDSCKFINNTVKTTGSSICIWSVINPIKITISNSTFSNNKAGGNFDSAGWDFKNYGNGTIYHQNGYGKVNTINLINCKGIVKNADKFKVKLMITAPSVSAVYKNKKYLIATIKNGVPQSNYKGLKVTIKLNGKTYNKTIDSKSQVKLLVGNLIPNNYTAKITVIGDNFYLKVSKSVKVVVKKATPKLSAANKAFKRKLRTKKYTVTLKNHKGTVLKSYKLTLRVKGKTFTAKTNSKGKATFKITNLSRKGTFKAVIKYAGNKYYKKISKTVKITAK